MIVSYNKFNEGIGIRDEYTKMGVHKYYTDNKETYINPHENNIKLVLDWVTKQINITGFVDVSCGNGEVTAYLKTIGIGNGIGTDPYFCDIYTEKTGNECLKLSFEDIAINGLDVHKQTIICSYALHLCPDSYFSQLMYNLSLNCKYFILISPSKYPTITEDYFNLIDETIINRTHCKIFKSKNSINEGINQYLKGPNEEEMWNYFNELQTTPNETLLKSCQLGFLPGVKFALKHDADISYNNNNPLSYAAFHGNLEIVKYIISNGAKVTPQDYENILYSAVEGGNLDVIDYLIEQGADPTNNDGYIVSFARKYAASPEVITYLRKKIKSINDSKL